MKVLMLSTDRKIFERGSDVEQRMLEYGSLTEVLHIIVLSISGANLENKKLGNNVLIYPTNSKNRWHYIRDAIRIGKTLERPDLVTTQDPSETGIVGKRLAKHHRSQLHLQVHTDILSSYFKKSSLLNLIRARMAYRLFPKANCIRVVSERIKHNIIAHFGVHKRLPHITVLPIFVDTKQFENPDITFDLHDKYPQFEFVTLMVSRLEPEKDIYTALRAMESVVEKLPKSGLVIVGEGNERNKLEAYVQKHRLEKNVVFLGWRDDVASFYNTADAYLLTSRFEGYARTLVESAISGCPIITTEVGIAGYVFLQEQSALIAPIGDDGTIARYLYRMATNKGLRRQLAAEAYRAQSQHGSKTNQEYLEAYKKSWEMCE